MCRWECVGAMEGAAQDPSQQRGGVRDPHSGPGPILDAAPQHGRAWAEQLAGNLQLDLRLTNLLPVRYHHTKSLVAFSTCGYRVR